MGKLRINGYITLLLVMSLSGCENRNKQNSSQDLPEQNITAETPETETGYQFPAEYVMDEGSVNFDVQILISPEAQTDNLAVKQAAVIKPDNEKIYSGLFEHTEVEDEQIIDFNNDDGSKGTSYNYNGSHGEHLSITDSVFYFRGNLFFYITNSFRLEENEQDSNADLYKRDDNLDFATQESALESIIQELSLLGIHLGSDIEYTCYVLDYQTLMQEESAIDMDGNIASDSYKDSWGKEDDCYYFCIRQTADGLPVTHVYADIFGRVEDSNAPIQVIISQNGIEMLTVDRIFDLSNNTKRAELAEFDRIAISIKEKYEELITDSTYTVTSAELYYLSIKEKEGKYEVKPVWVFSITEHVDNLEQIYHLQMIIDAQTGEEIIL